MKNILYFFVIQIIFSIIITVNSFVITDTKTGYYPDDDTTELDGKKSVIRNHRSLATNDRNKLWDEGIIMYEIDNSYTGQQRKLIKQAMRHLEQSTCLKFVPRIKEPAEDYLLFVKKKCGCCSSVGKQPIHVQMLSMADYCLTFGAILHELGHTLGLFHEHNRPDRDDYVEILEDNIMIGEEDNFDKEWKNQSTTLRQVYDYSSIMHYHRNDSAKKRNLDTIKPLRKINGEWPILGQHNGLSRGDIVMINLLYQCLRCGATLSEPRGSFSPPTRKITQLDLDYCQWTIKAAEGHRIKMSIKVLNIHESTDCSTDYLEIRNGYQGNNEVVAHYCGKYETTLTVRSNIVQIFLVKTHEEYHKPAFIIEYEAVCRDDIYIEDNDTYYVESPNYPEQYGPNKLCYWYISAPENHFISIKFYHFELQDSPGCINDVLEVREGDNIQAPIEGIYCGKNDNLKITSTGRLMFLRFVTDASINENGFSAIITAKPINDSN